MNDNAVQQILLAKKSDVKNFFIQDIDHNITRNVIPPCIFFKKAKTSKHCSPSRAESNHKDLIIAQLRDEIRELQHRECEYHEALTRLRELEIKMDTLQEEKVPTIYIKNKTKGQFGKKKKRQ